MYYLRKLKPKTIGTDLYTVFFTVPIIIIVFIIWGLRAGWALLAFIELVVVVIHLNMYFRTKNKYFLALSLSFLTIVALAVYIALFGSSNKDPVQISLMIAVIFALVAAGSIVSRKKIKWRIREIFELVAMPVNETTDGFTERPLYLGKIEITDHERLTFSRFIAQNLIAIPIHEKDKTIFSLSNSLCMQNGFSQKYENDSWVSFSYNGEVSVFITKNDYLQYKENFSFDQICYNTGRLFTEFFELFKKGEEIKILDRLNALNLNPFTE